MQAFDPLELNRWREEDLPDTVLADNIQGAYQKRY